MVDAVETKLKSCPFCGGQTILTYDNKESYFYAGRFNKDVVVNKCNVKMQFIEKCSGIIIFTVFFMDKL